jgi:hypothetical protein
MRLAGDGPSAKWGAGARLQTRHSPPAAAARGFGVVCLLPPVVQQRGPPASLSFTSTRLQPADGPLTSTTSSSRRRRCRQLGFVQAGRVGKLKLSE